MPSALPSRASVVVAGGGAMGTSIAFHLAEAGVEDVLLLERAELASGSTSKAAGGVRAQFSDELNVAIALRSLEAYGAFGVRPGRQIDLRRVGYLFLLDDPGDVTAFELSVALQNGLGVPSRLVEPVEAGARAHGARIEMGCEVTAVETDGGAIRRVVTPLSAARFARGAARRERNVV